MGCGTCADNYVDNATRWAGGAMHRAVDKKLRDLRKRQLSATTPEQASRIEQQTLVIMRRYNQRYNRLEQ